MFAVLPEGGLLKPHTDLKRQFYSFRNLQYHRTNQYFFHFRKPVLTSSTVSACSVSSALLQNDLASFGLGSDSVAVSLKWS